MSYESFKAKFLTDEPVYFKYSFEEAVIRFEPGGKYFIKFRGNPEFETKHSNRIVNEGFLEYTEITKAEYDNW